MALTSFKLYTAYHIVIIIMIKIGRRNIIYHILCIYVCIIILYNIHVQIHTHMFLMLIQIYIFRMALTFSMLMSAWWDNKTSTTSLWPFKDANISAVYKWGNIDNIIFTHFIHKTTFFHIQMYFIQSILMLIRVYIYANYTVYIFVLPMMFIFMLIILYLSILVIM